MKGIMEMHIDTTWGNRVTLSVEVEHDNGHDISTGQLARLQVHTLSMMVAEVRAQNERQIDIRHEEESIPHMTDHTLSGSMQEGGGQPGRREFETQRFEEMEREQRGK